MYKEYFAESPVKVRTLTVDDYQYVLAWSKDEIFCSANGWGHNKTETELYQWWIQCVGNRSDEFVRMGIEFKSKLIGYADLAYIKNNSAELGIAIGESKLWGNGLGSRAAKCMIDFGFKELGIIVFYAETHSSNIRSRKMLEKIEFHEIGQNGTEVYLGEENQLIQYRLLL